MQAEFLEPHTGAMMPATSVRKAALLLHSMTESDRQWMLARVDQAQRDRLEALLMELTALEFPVDPDLVRESLAAVAASATMPRIQPGDLSTWSVEQAASVLLCEPTDVIALVLRAGDWEWASGLRSRLGAQRASAVAASRYSAMREVSATLLNAAAKVAWARFLALQSAPAGSHVDYSAARRAP